MFRGKYWFIIRIPEEHFAVSDGGTIEKRKKERKMNVLVINCGSSSLKFQLINSETEDVLAKGLCERMCIEVSQLVYQPEDGE